MDPITGQTVEAFVSGGLAGIIICSIVAFGYMLYRERIQKLNKKIERLEDDN